MDKFFFASGRTPQETLSHQVFSIVNCFIGLNSNLTENTGYLQQ